MSTIIIAIILFGLAFLGFRHYIKRKGSCGDCECSCPIKDEMHQSHRHQ
ncbi:FeoB-associated Cys-rich membrane protein [Streptococcus parasanguinis]|nr:FeoB-associated Cys-rich membrane protein [Streptococcus parasanguinis]MBT3137685.1 FeoB-associated Cys-rich membrane protein [Streptococcus parasanguinis]